MGKRKLKAQLEELIDKFESYMTRYYIEDLIRDVSDITWDYDTEYKAGEEELAIHFDYMRSTFWLPMAIKSCKDYKNDQAFKIDWYNCIVPIEDEEVKERVRSFYK